MLEVSNSTPFPAACVPFTDAEGREQLVVVVKATYQVEPRTGAATTAEEQVPILRADEYHGEPGESSIRAEADTCPPKPGCDVILAGHAYPRRPKDPYVDVGLTLGSLRKTVRVFGDRAWRKGLGGWQPSPPEPFERVPLIWERAFGGVDTTSPKPEEHAWEPRNPVGTGLIATGSAERMEGLALPNLEDPESPVKRWKDRPDPMGFGVVGRGWKPRCDLAGTYDEKWQEERSPLLPLDFDPRYFNAAAAGLVAEGPLSGGETLRVAGAHPSGEMLARLPRRALAVTAWVKGELRRAEPALDTVRIEPDEERILLIWRASIPCSREFLHVRSVFIKEAAA